MTSLFPDFAYCPRLVNSLYFQNEVLYSVFRLDKILRFMTSPFFQEKSRRILQPNKRNCLPVSSRCKLSKLLKRSNNSKLDYFHIFDVIMTQNHARIDNFFKNLSQSHHYATCAHSIIRTIALGTLLTNLWSSLTSFRSF